LALRLAFEAQFKDPSQSQQKKKKKNDDDENKSQTDRSSSHQFAGEC